MVSKGECAAGRLSSPAAHEHRPTFCVVLLFEVYDLLTTSPSAGASERAAVARSKLWARLLLEGLLRREHSSMSVYSMCKIDVLVSPACKPCELGSPDRSVYATLCHADAKRGFHG